MMKFAGLENAVKTAINEKAMELEGWKELLKNKTWEITKPNITLAKDLIKPNLTALKADLDHGLNPVDFLVGLKDAKPSLEDIKGVDKNGTKLADLHAELEDLYAFKANLTKVEKMAKKEMMDSAEGKLEMLANLTDGVKEGAEDKIMGVKEGAEEKLEALINATAAVKGEVMDKVVDLKNATLSKVDMLGEEKEEMMGHAANITGKFMDKKAAVMGHALNATGKLMDAKMDVVGHAKNTTAAKVDMLMGEKEDIMGHAVNATGKLMDKKAMLMGKGGAKKNVTTKA